MRGAMAPEFAMGEAVRANTRDDVGDVMRHITCSAIASLFAVYLLSSPGRTCEFGGVFDGSFGVPHPRSIEVAVAVRRAVEEGMLPPSTTEPIVRGAESPWRETARL